MNVTSLYCGCVGGEVPTNHYSSGACPRPPAPLPWLLAIQEKIMNDPYHHSNVMSATRLSDCWRKHGIGDNLPIPALDLMRYNSIAHGWAVHEFMAKWSPKGYMTEVPLDGILFEGTPFEVRVRGSVDVLKPTMTYTKGGRVVLLEDYKVTSEWSQVYRTKNPDPKAEWDIQASVYRILAEKSDASISIEKAAIWSGACVAKKSKAKLWVEIPIRWMNEEEILAARPYEGATSIADHLMIRKRFLEQLAGGMEIKEAVAVLPLTGVEQAAFICDYCPLSHVCAGLVGKGGLE